MLNIVMLMICIQPVEIQEFTLDNGLKILVYEDHFAPVVSTQIHYRVGAYNEPLGLTGISHLLEHMAFKGTKKYGAQEYWRRIEEAGGMANAYTSANRTVYFANLGKDRYEIELELEAERMQNLLIAEAEFIPEKQVVMEERRLRENDPYGSFFEQLDLVSYSIHPYRRPIIGFMADIERISRDDLYQWYRQHYNPANAVVVIAGDVTAEEAYRAVRKHFGKIKGRTVDEIPYEEPAQRGERRFEYRKEVRTSALAIHYHTVNIVHEDVYALDVLSMILSYGLSSRFEQDIVREQGLAVTANVYHMKYKYAGSFLVFAIPQSGVKLADLEHAIHESIDRLKTIPVSAAELDKARNQTLASAVYQQDSPTGVGMRAGWWEIEAGGWRNMNRYFEEIGSVNEGDIMRVARTYFTRDNRTVGYLLPEEEE
ncbi:insulinase family protein [candidate division WOR-3 bacterium]|nr:insulinase family protein [candidate division WOR-3 bacterium]